MNYGFDAVIVLHRTAALAALGVGALAFTARKGPFARRVAGLFTLLPHRLLGHALWPSLGLI